MGLPLRILHVVPTYLPAIRYGGPIYSVHGLCKAQVEFGHDVRVFTTNVDGPGVSNVPIAEPIDVDGVKVRYFPTGLGRRLYRSPAMAKALERSVATFDVVHLHSVFLWPTHAAARTARAHGVPYILTPRGMLIGALIRRKSRFLKRAWLALFGRAAIEAASAVHMTTELEAAEFAKLKLKARRIRVIPNGVDSPPEASAARRRESAAFKWRILSLGRLSWKKGLDRLVEATVDVPEAELVIAGNDEDGLWPRLDRLAQRCGVGERVVYVGPIYGDSKWDLIRSADLFVMPSASENFGLATLEAMACGRPVVVTPDVGLAPTILEAGAGLVVEAEPRVLGGALARLLAAGPLRTQMGEAGRAAATRFSWVGIVEQMDAAYAEVISERRDFGQTRER